MIAFLRGRVLEKQPNRVLVDVNGVGYEVVVPLSTFYDVGDEGAEVALFSHSDMHWLSRVRTLYIDAHSVQAIRTLQGVAAEHGFTFQRHRELCVLNRK